ncbi:MAG: prepilin-type N-terminal cleavage/methylation domain-containing protein [Candidatus Pacebacteria bacterium]|nr:prepilin-type N-terminal cleavage/methylation domain-containing protein [Candidatus Paceibacterota bacterium]
MKSTSLKAKNKKGFTIVETLVAITILVLALTAPLSIVAQALHSSYFARDQVTAFYLGQDVVEYIHNQRDANSLANLSDSTQWLNGLSKCFAATGCQIDAISGQITDYAPGSYLYISNTTGAYRYTQTGGTPTNFTRTVFITNPDGSTPTGASKEVVIKAVVSWNTGSLVKSYILNDHLFNWVSVSSS